MGQQSLFEVAPGSVGKGTGHKEEAGGAPRVQEANRSQVEFRTFDLDSLLPSEHQARAVWAVLAEMDLGKFYEHIGARGSAPGRPAIDPRILVGLWLYATAEGVGSARELDRLCTEHNAYRWLAGGVSVNYHTLSDFRVSHQSALEDLMTQVLAAMMGQGLVELNRVSQDGLRIRASAGASSFRRKKKLKGRLIEARKQVRAVGRLIESSDSGRTKRQEAAQARAAQERVDRVKRACAELERVEKARKKLAPSQRSKQEARASTTDPEARVMRMPDGGYRPGYNVQLAADTKYGVVVGVQVTNSGVDAGRAPGMVEQIKKRLGQAPEELLVDGGYADQKSVKQLSESGVVVYAPVPPRRGHDPHVVLPKDNTAIAQWRERMGSEEGKKIYKERAATIERVNADVRTHRTLDRMLVRGTSKILNIALWNALTFNLLRWLALGGPNGL